MLCRCWWLTSWCVLFCYKYEKDAYFGFCSASMYRQAMLSQHDVHYAKLRFHCSSRRPVMLSWVVCSYLNLSSDYQTVFIVVLDVQLCCHELFAHIWTSAVIAKLRFHRSSRRPVMLSWVVCSYLNLSSDYWRCKKFILDKITNLSVLDKKSKIHNLGQTLDEKWPTDHRKMSNSFIFLYLLDCYSWVESVDA